ncbi:MAG: hypothetical protein ACYDEO_23590 [Aggregatilineales bacterium]
MSSQNESKQQKYGRQQHADLGHPCNNGQDTSPLTSQTVLIQLPAQVGFFHTDRCDSLLKRSDRFARLLPGKSSIFSLIMPYGKA